MKVQYILIFVAILCMIGFLLLHRFSLIPHDEYSIILKSKSLEIDSLLQLLKIQNETIKILETHLSNVINKPTMNIDHNKQFHEDKKLLEISDTITRLSRNNKQSNHLLCSNQSISIDHIHLDSNHNDKYLLNDMEKECENRYGMELASLWKRKSEIWCSNNNNINSNKQRLEEEEKEKEYKSELKCYPYVQTHKKLDGRGSDMFCVATNFIIDFHKIDGTIVTKGKPMKGSEYLKFQKDSIIGNCHKTSYYKNHLFMPHHKLQMNSFQSDIPILKDNRKNDYIIHELPIYLLARDEDCENSFHSTADFMNMFLVYSILNIKQTDIQVMLFDRFSNGPYYELIQKAFSTNHPVLRHDHYQNNKVLFKKIIFHLESPAGLIFPKVSRPDPMRCYQASLFDSYRRFVLHSFDLLNVKPPAIPSVTLTLRHRTPAKNVGRVLANEQEIVDVLKTGNLMNLQVVDTAKMSYFEQLKLIRNTNVLIGIHGAGLMFIMFAAEEAVLLEIHPSYRQDRHFRHAARMTGKIYMPMRTLTRETCVGSSDSVTVPVAEFRNVVDGAIRIARSFDDGLSECGLVCPGSILALDSKLQPHYKPHEKRVNPINTIFPC